MIAAAYGHAGPGFFNHAFWWLEVHTGTVNEAGPWYGFWSGFAGELSYIAIFGAVIGGIRRMNCHVKGCWRLGAHPVYRPDGAPTPYHACKTHHPRVDHTQRVTAETIRVASQTTLAEHDAAVSG